MTDARWGASRRHRVFFAGGLIVQGVASVNTPLFETRLPAASSRDNEPEKTIAHYPQFGKRALGGGANS